MTGKTYDVFLSFNSEDREAVERIARYLADKVGLHPWFDHWELIPGESWVRNLERGLEASSTCAVFVGKSGEGPWQEREVETALRYQVNSYDFRVIPVLLPNAPHKPKLPMFLSGNMWVDFRRGGLENDDALWRLECGIRGKAPGRGRPQPTLDFTFSDEEELDLAFSDEEELSRDFIKTMVHSCNPESFVECPFCKAKTKAKNLLHHCDKQHFGGPPSLEKLDKETLPNQNGSDELSILLDELDSDSQDDFDIKERGLEIYKGHTFVNGVCIRCHCSKTAVEHFGWKCKA